MGSNSARAEPIFKLLIRKGLREQRQYVLPISHSAVRCRLTPQSSRSALLEPGVQDVRELAGHFYVGLRKGALVDWLHWAIVLWELLLEFIEHDPRHRCWLLHDIPMDLLGTRRGCQRTLVVVEASSELGGIRVQVQRLLNSHPHPLRRKIFIETKLFQELNFRTCAFGGRGLLEQHPDDRQVLRTLGAPLLVDDVELTRREPAIHRMLCREVEVELLDVVVSIRQEECAKVAVHLHVLCVVVEHITVFERLVLQAALQGLLAKVSWA
mmetsp:Transcript_28010/g.80351  ORF Transcript_28010/g.80351 Transcript_28010/m.80351 type:complete len:268 (+) Transcript_28010:211-1014(+)